MAKKKTVPEIHDYTPHMGVGHNQANYPEINKLAKAQFDAQEEVERLENELKAAKEELREISEKKLPEAMDKLHLSNITTTEGISVQVSEKIRASLSPENRPNAYAWLEEKGFGAIIKSEVVINFSRNKLEEAHKLVGRLRDENLVANLDRKVEPATLTAFVKEQLEEGKDIPLNIFGVFRQRVARVEV